MRTPRIVFKSDRSIAKLRALVAFLILVTLVGINTFPAAAAAVDLNLSAFTFAVPRSITHQIRDLIQLVESFGLPRRPENSLITKLDAAVAAGEPSDTATVCDSITAFINECLAQSGTQLTPEQSTQLINLANQIKSSLGCP